jgi:hypothetical protein
VPKAGSFNARSGEQLTIKKLAKEHLGFAIVTWLSDDETMTRYRHCVVTLTDSQFDPKFVVLLPGHPPNARIPNVLGGMLFPLPPNSPSRRGNRAIR